MSHVAALPAPVNVLRVQSALVYGLCVFKARVNNARVFVWPVVLFLRDRQCRMQVMRFVNSTRAGSARRGRTCGPMGRNGASPLQPTRARSRV